MTRILAILLNTATEAIAHPLPDGRGSVHSGLHRTARVSKRISQTICALCLAACPLLPAAGSAELFVAIREGDHAQVSKLLRAGAGVNAADSDGTTALMHSVIESDARMMKLLIDAGANCNAKNALDSTALMYAATNLAKTRILLDAGAEVRVTGKRGATPMSVAVTAFGSTPVLRLLTAKGAPPEDRLMTAAAQKGDLEAIRFLLGIGVSAGDSSTVSAAVTGRCEACVRLLVEKGTPVSGLQELLGGLHVLTEAWA